MHALSLIIYRTRHLRTQHDMKQAGVLLVFSPAAHNTRTSPDNSKCTERISNKFRMIRTYEDMNNPS